MSTKPSTNGVRIRYEFIKAHRKQYSVQSMCREFGVAQSGYYEWLKQPISKHDQEDDYIDTFYNRSRRHSYLAGLSPDQFEAAHRRNSLH